jgi:hypothetical protein
MRGAHDKPPRPDHHVAFADARHGDRRLHLHAADRMHPEHRVLGIVDQDARQNGIGPPAGHPQQIVHVIRARVGRDALVEILVFALDAGQQRRELMGVVERDAQHPSGPVRVAAPHVAWRLLQHEHFRGAVLVRRDGGGKRRVPGTDDDDVVFFHWLSLFYQHAVRQRLGLVMGHLDGGAPRRP